MQLITYHDLCYEHATIYMEIEDMSDEDLIDECAHLLVNFTSDSMETAVTSYFRSGKLSKEERAGAEGFYKLAYGELMWEE